MRDARPRGKTSVRFGGRFGSRRVRRRKAPSWLWGSRRVRWLLLEANVSLSRTFCVAQPQAGPRGRERVTEPQAPRGDACREKPLLRPRVRGELRVPVSVSPRLGAPAGLARAGKVRWCRSVCFLYLTEM